MIYTKGKGRFGNIFFRNMAGHFIGKTNNIKVEYVDKELFGKLGITFFNIENNESYTTKLELDENNFMSYILTKQNIKDNLSLSNIFCQTKEFALFLRNNLNKDDIINKNISKDRYQNNNDVFIHVRLGDVIYLNAGLSYYEKVLNSMKFDNGYITSDTINHDICKSLIKKYNLKIINKNIIETIMFASTCKNIVLSNGTFSWMIGLLSFYSNIYYPKIKVVWHGDIFVFDDWNEIDF